MERQKEIKIEDYTMKKMVWMSVPIFIELFLQLLVGNVDQIMISHHSQNAVAAIGNANQIMGILIIFLNDVKIFISKRNIDIIILAISIICNANNFIFIINVFFQH